MLEVKSGQHWKAYVGKKDIQVDDDACLEGGGGASSSSASSEQVQSGKLSDPSEQLNWELEVRQSHEREEFILDRRSQGENVSILSISSVKDAKVDRCSCQPDEGDAAPDQQLHREPALETQALVPIIDQGAQVDILHDELTAAWPEV